jgi:hypothetical protein
MASDIQTAPVSLHPGDLCLTGRNSYPRFRVIAVVEDRAWVRDVETGKDAVVQVTHCKPILDDEDKPDAPPPPEPVRAETEPAPLTWPDGTPRP